MKMNTRKRNLVLLLALSAAVTGLFFGVAAIAPRKIAASEKQIIPCPQETVFNFLRYLENQQSMSFWPNWEAENQPIASGTDGEMGYSLNFANAGKSLGSFRLRRVIDYSFIECMLIYSGKQRAVWTTYISLAPHSENSTEVTWGFWSNVPYPRNITLLFANPSANYKKSIGASLQMVAEKLNSCP